MQLFFQLPVSYSQILDLLQIGSVSMGDLHISVSMIPLVLFQFPISAFSHVSLLSVTFYIRDWLLISCSNPSFDGSSWGNESPSLSSICPALLCPGLPCPALPCHVPVHVHRWIGVAFSFAANTLPSRGNPIKVFHFLLFHSFAFHSLTPKLSGTNYQSFSELN